MRGWWGFGVTLGVLESSAPDCDALAGRRLELGFDYSAADCYISLDHHEITCTTVAGVGGGMTWTVTVAGQSSVNPRTSYRAPFITGVAIVTPSGAVTNDSIVMASVDTSGRGLSDLL